MINKSKAGGVFRIQCLDPNGNLKWEAESHNLVVNEGLKYMNDVALDGGAQITTWYIGLYGAGASNNPAASDTMASHPGWTEVTAYTSTDRPVCTFGPATTADPSVITNTGSAASFSINASTTIGGAFLTSAAPKSPGNTGTLFSAADFTGNDRSVGSGDTLNVTYTFNLDAA